MSRVHVKGCRIEDDEGNLIDHDGICRDKNGKPRVVLPDGKTVRSYARASSYGDALDDKGGLIAWSQANAVRGVLTAPAIGERFLQVDDGWVTKEAKDATKAALDEAATAGGAWVKATRGTNLHDWTERIDRGLPLGPVPDEFLGDLAAYEYAVEQAELDHLVIEEFTVLDDYRIGGSPDRASVCPHPDPNGVVANRIVDLKTGSVGFPQKMSVQLSAYSRSVLYQQATVLSPEGEPIRATGVRKDLPPVDQNWALILNLPAGTGTAKWYWLDIAKGWKAITGDMPGGIPGVKAWRSDKTFLVPAEF